MVYDPEQMDPDASRSVCWFLITLSKLGVDVFDYDGTMTVQPIIDRFTSFIEMIGGIPS